MLARDREFNSFSATFLCAQPRRLSDNYMPCDLKGTNFAQWVVNGSFFICALRLRSQQCLEVADHPSFADPEPGGFGPLWTCQIRWDAFLSVPVRGSICG